jgi:hypothetical protein
MVLTSFTGRNLPATAAGEKDGQKVLEPEAIGSLIRLLYVAQPVSKGLLQRIMLSLAANPESRVHIIAILIERSQLPCHRNES